MSDRMKSAKDWTGQFRALYPSVMACLSAHPAQPAWANRVEVKGAGKIAVRMQGEDGRIMDCTIRQNAKEPDTLSDAFGLDFEQAAFFPITHGKPQEDACLTLEPVEKGWFFETIGWLAYHRCTPPWKEGEEHALFDLEREGSPVIEKAVLGLPEEAVKILAYVTARMNTACENGSCALTTALGLSKQCSDRHREALLQGVGEIGESRCTYAADGATRIIWADQLTLTHSAENEWRVSGIYTRADSRGQVKSSLRETYRVGDKGEIVIEDSSFDDWSR